MLAAMDQHPLDRDEAVSVLDPHLDRITSVLTAGWRAWEEATKDHRRLSAIASRRTRASLVHDAMTDEAERIFADVEGVHASKQRGFLTLTFDDRVILRFKKFRNKRLRTSGIMTNQRSQFEWQQIHIDGMAVTNVVAGYLVDKLQQGLERVAITCFEGKHNQWVLDLTSPNGSVGAVPLQLPLAPQPSEPGIAVRSARVDHAPGKQVDGATEGK